MMLNNPVMKSAVFCILVVLSVLSAPAFTAVALDQDLKPIFDARLTLKAAGLSPPEETLLKEIILPAAAKAWKEQEEPPVCESENSGEAIDVARGSFTKPGADQKAILYRYCTTGHNMAANGLAIIENNRVVSHWIYEGAWDNAIGALPDIDKNGRSEILIGSGGANQGITWGSIAIIELSDTVVITNYGRASVLSDNCGAPGKNCGAEAGRISVKPGNPPVFYRETFTRKGGSGKWGKSSGAKEFSLESNEVEFSFVK